MTFSFRKRRWLFAACLISTSLVSFGYASEELSDGFEVPPYHDGVSPSLSQPALARTPNAELLMGLTSQMVQACRQAVENFQTPAYQGILTNADEAFGVTLTDLLGYLETIPNPVEKTSAFLEKAGEIRRAIMSTKSEHDGSSPFGSRLDSMERGEWGGYQPASSRAHEKYLEKYYVQVLKRIDAYLEQAMYLASPLVPFIPRETCNESEVIPTYLPTNGAVEEGNAILRQEGNKLFIDVLESGTIITFDNFWIGAGAEVFVNMPDDSYSVSIYQRSGKPSFMFGKFHRGESGFIKLCAPYGQIMRGPFIFFRMLMKGGESYTPKDKCLYYQDFSRYGKVIPSESHDMPVSDFSSTPDGTLEAALLQHKKAMDEPSEETLDACRLFISICNGYPESSWSQGLAAIVEKNLAVYYHKKAVMAPFPAQGPFYKRVVQYMESAASRGLDAAVHQLPLAKLNQVAWLHKKTLDDKVAGRSDGFLEKLKQTVFMAEELVDKTEEVHPLLPVFYKNLQIAILEAMQEDIGRGGVPGTETSKRLGAEHDALRARMAKWDSFLEELKAKKERESAAAREAASFRCMGIPSLGMPVLSSARK